MFKNRASWYDTYFEYSLTIYRSMTFVMVILNHLIFLFFSFFLISPWTHLNCLCPMFLVLSFPPSSFIWSSLILILEYICLPLIHLFSIHKNALEEFLSCGIELIIRINSSWWASSPWICLFSFWTYLHALKISSQWVLTEWESSSVCSKSADCFLSCFVLENTKYIISISDFFVPLMILWTL